MIPRILGIIGLLLITWGVLEKKETRQDILFIVGGLGLLAYSISLKDPIFIPLQIIFISTSAWELYTLTKKRT